MPPICSIEQHGDLVLGVDALQPEGHGSLLYVLYEILSRTVISAIQVETTSSTDQDTTPVDRTHTALAEKQLLPSQHFVDAGYPSAEALATSENSFGIDLYGPVRPDITR